jgi:lysophospholipase
MSEEYQFITSAQGIKIYFRQKLPTQPKAIVIVSHGYAEHSGFYIPLMEFLASKGYGVYALDHRGHGHSEEERGHLEKFEFFLEDMDAFVDYIQGQHPELPLYLFGHSMGGLISFSYGIFHPEKIHGQIFSGAALGRPEGTEWIPSWVLKGVKRFLNRYKVYPVLSRRGTRNMEIRKYSGGDPLVLKYATAGFFYEFIGRGVRFAQGNAACFSLPCLFLHGTDDRIVPHKSSSNIFEKISSEDKELKFYEGLYHELVQEPEREEVMKDILTWLDERIGQQKGNP